MNKPVDPTRFTPQEIQAALIQKRVFFDPLSDSTHPIIVFVKAPEVHWEIADAWHIDANGLIKPDEPTPVPIRYRDVKNLDLSVQKDRDGLVEFALSKPVLRVYGLAKQPGGVISIGVGTTEVVCMLDAIARLKARFPKLTVNHREAATPPEQLLADLQDGTARITIVGKRDYPSQESMGHNYATNETYQLAAAAASDAKLYADVQALIDASKEVDGEAVRSLCMNRIPFVVGSHDSALIDWYEVAESIKPEVADEQITPKQAPSQAPVAAVKARSIEADVLAVLRRATASAQLIRLGPERLDRTLYTRVNDVLVALGGKWVGGKTQAHKFTEDAGPILDTAIATGSFTKPQDFGFFPTQPDLVERVLSMVTIEPGMKMLEPNGGTGAFAVPMAKAGEDMSCVTTYELLPKNVQVLRDAGLKDVREGDFLQASPEPIYDLVVMNPPFAGGADVAHLMHATRFLKPTGELIAITSTSWSNNGSKKAQTFRDFVGEVEGEVEPVEAGAFKKSGTNVATQIVRMDASKFPWNRVEADATSERSNARERMNC